MWLIIFLWNKQTLLALRWVPVNCQVQLCPPGKLPWDTEEAEMRVEGNEGCLNGTNRWDWHREAWSSKPDDSSENHSAMLLIPLLSHCLVFAPRWVWLSILPPRKHPYFVALPSWATVVIVIMLPQQCGALKRGAITLVEDFKFHTRTVEGNGTSGALDKVLIEETIHHPCVFHGKHSCK